MSWAKRNIYFLASCIVAVLLLGVAGWYCWSSWQSNNANWEQLKGAYGTLGELALKPYGPGNESVDNIKTAKEQAAQVKQRVAEMEKFFTPVKPITDTNKLNDRVLQFALRDLVAQLRSAARDKGVTIPPMNPEFAFSFSLQMGKTMYEPNSAEILARQMSEVKAICETLFGARILQLDSVQRERTADDANPGQVAIQPDYTDSISLTSGNMVITPYQVTFECYTPQLGLVLSSFANQSHTIVVKTLSIQPTDAIGMDGGGGLAGYINVNNYPGAATAPVAPPPGSRPGALTTIIDEKRLKVTMLLDFVKITPGQGR